MAVDYPEKLLFLGAVMINKIGNRDQMSIIPGIFIGIRVCFKSIHPGVKRIGERRGEYHVFMGKSDITQARIRSAVLVERIVTLEPVNPASGHNTGPSCSQVISEMVIIDDGTCIVDLEQRIELVGEK